MKTIKAGLLLYVASVVAAWAGAIKTETVEYTVDGVTMRGYLARPDGVTVKRPGVLVFPEWMGLNDYAKRKARELAELGYVALAADPYGEGKTAKDAQEAGAWAGALKTGDRADLRKRAVAALAALKRQALVDPERVGAIGYCFGGTAVLELARTGAELRAVVSFHGGLDTPNAADPKTIKASVLVCHGADDPTVSKAVVDGFMDEMRRSGTDWQMVFYGGAVHSFSNPDSGTDKAKGVAYNEKADKRSWSLMRLFFSEKLGDIN